jgi:hypothetical protein
MFRKNLVSLAEHCDLRGFDFLVVVMIIRGILMFASTSHQSGSQARDQTELHSQIQLLHSGTLGFRLNN